MWYEEFDHNCLEFDPAVSAVEKDLDAEEDQTKSNTQAEHHTEAPGVTAQLAGTWQVCDSPPQSWNHIGQCMESSQHFNPEMTFHQGDSGAADGMQINKEPDRVVWHISNTGCQLHATLK